jgi:hypothetical protein
LELRDIIVTPLVIILVYGVAYLVRPMVTDSINRAYFFPALTMKIIGALAVGFIYQFYYDGGDTFNYHTHGSRHVWEAFVDSPVKGLKLLFANGSYDGSIYKYSSKIYFFTDPGSYAIVRFASIFDLITFSSYSATAVLFAVFSFIGMWLFFLTFYERYPEVHQWLAFSAFFIPSVFFWGSGLLKDTITLGCLGMSTYSLYKIFIDHKSSPKLWLLLLMSLYALWSIKLYILLTFLPAAIVWIFVSNLQYARVFALRMLLFPFVIICASLLGYYAILKAGEDSERYAIGNLARTARITAYDIRYYTGRTAGSGYSLGELDGSFSSMLTLAPQAINVSLFRPYLWEVNNPLMLLSALESFFLLIFCIIVMVKCNIKIWKFLLQPDILFTLLFSIPFAFAVGVSTFNFGTLVRYKIPMLPFLTVALALIVFHSNNARKVAELERTE